MSDPDTISADYSLRPSELADTLALPVEARRPTIAWGPPGCAKSQIAQQVTDRAYRRPRPAARSQPSSLGSL